MLKMRDLHKNSVGCQYILIFCQMIIILQCKLFDNYKQPNESSTNNRKSIKRFVGR